MVHNHRLILLWICEAVEWNTTSLTSLSYQKLLNKITIKNWFIREIVIWKNENFMQSLHLSFSCFTFIFIVWKKWLWFDSMPSVRWSDLVCSTCQFEYEIVAGDWKHWKIWKKLKYDFGSKTLTITLK